MGSIATEQQVLDSGVALGVAYSARVTAIEAIVANANFNDVGSLDGAIADLANLTSALAAGEAWGEFDSLRQTLLTHGDAIRIYLQNIRALRFGA